MTFIAMSLPEKGSPVGSILQQPQSVKSGASVSPNWNIWDIIGLSDSVYTLCYVGIRDGTHSASAGLYCELIWRYCREHETRVKCTVYEPCWKKHCTAMLFSSTAREQTPVHSLCLRVVNTSADVRDQLHWLPVQQRIKYKECVLEYKCLHQAAPTYLSEYVHVSVYIRQQKPPPLGSMRRPRSTSIQNIEIWSEKFRRLWSDPVELPAAECSRFVFNSNSVLYASEDCSVQ